MDCRMVHTFATHEDAAIFASAKRAEGYHAEILDGCVGMIYGPLAIGGLRVMVSEEALPNGDDTEEQEITVPPPPWVNADDGEFLTTVRMIVVGIAALGLLVVAIALFYLLLQMIRLMSQEPVVGALALFRMIQFPLGIALAFVLLAPWMHGFTRWLRGEELSEGEELLRWLFLAVIVPILLLAL